MTRTLIKPDDKVGLKLTVAERTLLLEDLLYFDQELIRTIHETPAGQPVPLTLDDLDELAGWIAAETNHTSDKKQQKELDRVFEKIGLLLDAYTDDPNDRRDIADKAVKFGEWTATMLAFIDNLGISRDSIHVDISLSAHDYITLLNLGTIGDDIKDHFRAVANDETTRVSASQLASICFGISEALVDATQEEQERLNGVAAKVAGLLTASLTTAVADSGRAKQAQAKRERRARKKANASTDDAITRPVKLTQAQRKVVAETKPEFASRLKLDEKNQRTIQMTPAELHGIQKAAQDAVHHADTGLKRTSLRHVIDITGNAIEHFEA